MQKKIDKVTLKIQQRDLKMAEEARSKSVISRISFNNDPLNLIDNYRSKSPNVNKRRVLMDLPNLYSNERRNIQSESQKKRVHLSQNRLYKTFLEENPYDQPASEVKFSRSGMRVKESIKIAKSQRDGESIYDPQAQYDEIASRYQIENTDSKSCEHEHHKASMVENPTVSRFKKIDFSNTSLEIDASDNAISEKRKTYDIEKAFQQCESKAQPLTNPAVLLEHRETINALMISMKPKLTQMLFVKYTDFMLKEFFCHLRHSMEPHDHGHEKKETKKRMLAPGLKENKGNFMKNKIITMSSDHNEKLNDSNFEKLFAPRASTEQQLFGLPMPIQVEDQNMTHPPNILDIENPISPKFLEDIENANVKDEDALAPSFDNDSISKEVGRKVKQPLNNIISDRESHVFISQKMTLNSPTILNDTTEPQIKGINHLDAEFDLQGSTQVTNDNM